MHMFRIFLSSLLVAAVVSFPAFAENCDPGSSDTSCLTTPPSPCATAGMTTMDVGGHNIIACLNDSNGKSVWKSMSSSSQLSVRVVTAVVVAYRWPFAKATCADDEVMTGGGGRCYTTDYLHDNRGYNYVYASEPSGNGWAIYCDSPLDHDITATAYAVCAKK